MSTPLSRVDAEGDLVSACCSTYGNVAGAQFDEKIARRDLENYRKKGPGPTARLLRDMLVDAGAADGTLLDIGSGIGGLTFELLERGVQRATAVDASNAYPGRNRPGGDPPLKGNPFRAFVHPVDHMTRSIERAGFRLAERRGTWHWSADVWVR